MFIISKEDGSAVELAEFVAGVGGDGTVQGRQGQVRLLLRMLHLHERREMVCLTTHSTHFIYENAATGGKEGNVLFNDALNTFHLRKC